MYVLTELCRPVQLVVCGSLLGSVTDINWKSMQTLCPDSGNYTPWPSFPWDVHLVLSLFSYSNSWTATLYKSRTHTHWSLSSILIFNVTLQCVILEVWDQLFFLQGFRSGSRNRSDKESCGSKHNLLQSDCNIETESSGKQRVGVSAVLNRWTCKWAKWVFVSVTVCVAVWSSMDRMQGPGHAHELQLIDFLFERGICEYLTFWQLPHFSCICDEVVTFSRM